MADVGNNIAQYEILSTQEACIFPMRERMHAMIPKLVPRWHVQCQYEISSISEALSDPIILAMMRADKIDAESLQKGLEDIRAKLRKGFRSERFSQRAIKDVRNLHKGT